VFSRNNPKFVLREQLRSAIVAFYSDQNNKNTIRERERKRSKEKIIRKPPEYVYQCKDCLSVYDSSVPDVDRGIPDGTAFESLPENYECSLCEASKNNFVKIEKTALGFV
jgi:rubredoxin